MPVFVYTALTDNGRVQRGERVAASPQILARELAVAGLLVEKIREKGPLRGLFSRRIAGEVVLMFTHEFTALLRAGLTVPEALAAVSERKDAVKLGAILGQVLEAVRAGTPLSDAAAGFPEAFDEVFVSALRTGEKTGDFTTPLQRYQDYLRTRLAIQKRVGQAMTYPVFLLVTLVVIMVLLFVFVIPRFVTLYADFEAELPLPTQILVSFVENIIVAGPFAVAGLAALIVGLRLFLRTEAGRMRMGEILLHAPLIGPLTRTGLIAHLSRTLSTLLMAGLPLVDALATTRTALKNEAYAHRLDGAITRVTEGQSLSRAFREERLIPETGLKLVEAGEAAGSLEEMLEEVGRYYQEVMDHRLGRVMALIEPSLMLLMGVLVGGIIVIMYLPIFNLTNILQ